MFLTPLLVRAAPWALLVCMGCVEPVQLSVNEPLDSGPPDVSLLDAALEADGLPRPDQAPPLPENTDAAPQPEPAECGNGQIEEGEQCDEPGDGCVDCRVVRLGVCQPPCLADQTKQMAGLTYIESISDFSVEGDTHFGSSLAVFDRRAIIGAPGTNVADEAAAEATGQVYFVEFSQGRWRREFNETGFFSAWPETGAAGAQFGEQVAMDGRMAFVSARLHQNEDGGLGRVYGYSRRDNGTWQAHSPIAISAGGALGKGLALIDSGLAYNIRSEDGYHFLRTFLVFGDGGGMLLPANSDPGFDGNLGDAIALKGQWLLASVEPLTMDPRVVVYQREGLFSGSWDRVRAYRPEGATEPSSYGFSVDSYSNWNVFGAPTDEHEGVRCGAVYLIRDSEQSQRLTPEPCIEGARFGHSVAMEGARLLVGAPGYGDGSGQVFSYQREGRMWLPDGPSVTDPHGEGTRFGTTVGLGRDFALVGAPREPGVAEGEMGRGRVHVYHFEGSLCFEDDGSCLCEEGAVGDRCECGLETYEGSEYLFCDEQMSWQSAREACTSHGMDLAVVDGAEENRWLADTRAVRLGAPAWLGLRDIDMMANWVWVDGSPLSYTAWNGGQPDNPMDDQQDCVALNGIGWEDFRCSREQPFMCEPVQQPSDNP